jgi:HEAT repeat protein
VRYESAAALVNLGDSSGFAVLVDGLSDSDLRARYKCFESLKRATGQDFGYHHDADPETRRVAVARWMSWLEGLRANAL